MKLRTSIMILISVFTLLMGVFAMLLSSPIIKQGFSNIDEVWGETLVLSLSEGIANDTINGNADRVRQVLETIVQRNNELSYAFVVDFNGRIFAHTFKDGFPLKLVELIRVANVKDDSRSIASAKHASYNSKDIRIDGENFDDVSYPIVNGMTAELHLGISQKADEALVAAINRKLLMIIFTLGLFGILIAILVSRKLTSPLDRLGQLMQDYGLNKIKGQIIIPHASPEIEKLRDAFNQMVKARSVTETALLESEARLEKAQEIAQLGYWSVNLDTNEIKGSDLLYQFFGLSREESFVENYLDVIHPQDREHVAGLIPLALETREGWETEYRVVLNNGVENWIHAMAEVVVDEHGNIIELMGTVQGITERKQAEQKLQQFRNTLDQTLDCVFMFDADKLYFSYVNEGALKQVGYTRAELLTMHPYDIKPEFSEAQFREMLVPLLAGEQVSLNFETIHQHKSGLQVKVEIFLQYISSEYYQGGFVAVVRDITERKRIEAELDTYRNQLELKVVERTADMKVARDQAERANQAKSEFLSRMSHELRTPMNAILGFGQMLEMDADALSENQQSSVKEILDAGQHLLNLINEVLDLARIESGKMEISIETVLIEDVLQQCINLIQPEAKIRHLELVDHVSSKGYIVQADFTRLKQVLMNLLSNAAKYNCEHGQVILDSKILDSQRLRISVTDTGKGLSDEEIAKLFTSFERMDVINNVEGTGIGLVITKHLIELMGGSIGVDSNKGEGSTFWIELLITQTT